jgi:chromate transporter
MRIGFVSFGGPAGQIALLHREVVERRRWIDERAFDGALNFCMLLPGPEALQLAIYLGWRLHGVRGGLVAGLGFILPAIALLFVLSWTYVSYGRLAWLAGVLFGLQCAVVALVLQAWLRIAHRALRTVPHAAIAIAAFVALRLGVAFPWVLLAAALAGTLLAGGATDARPVPTTHPGAGSQAFRILLTGLVLWLVPLMAVATLLGSGSLFDRLYLFFTQAALVTFGGAYAVLGYVTAHLVENVGWVTADQAVAGLALAETTPGPLVIVLQFLGFVAGWNQPGPLAPLTAAVVGGALAAWATFLPSFVLIFLGAPYVERLTHDARIGGALAAITAAVVAVIAQLGLLLAQVVLWPRGWTAAPDPAALAISVAAWFALERAHWPFPVVLACAAALGMSWQLAQ